VTVAGLLYRELFDRGAAAGADRFDLHVAASIVALAAEEAHAEGVKLAERTGLDGVELAQLSSLMFPGGIAANEPGPEVGAEELALRDILWMNSARASAFEFLLMERHFPRLARRNSGDMKWKKFFYRMMCTAEGFQLCAAPVCTECDDFEDCFGSEEGDALLARIANRRDLSAAPPSLEAQP